MILKIQFNIGYMVCKFIFDIFQAARENSLIVSAETGGFFP